MRLIKINSLIQRSNFNTKDYTRFSEVFHIKVITQQRFHIINVMNVCIKYEQVSNIKTYDSATIIFKFVVNTFVTFIHLKFIRG